MICHLDDGASLAQRPHRVAHWSTQHRLGVVRRQRAFHLHLGIAVPVNGCPWICDFHGSKHDEEYMVGIYVRGVVQRVLLRSKL